uniref:F-box and leucine rich repeat protein 6 n=1 Tax=Cynoglossus semilaevis TaxID=244447 RepID=A0A3P8VHC5_CYNSE
MFKNATGGAIESSPLTDSSTASNQATNIPKSNTAPLKRKSADSKNVKTKKKKKARVSRSAQLGYTVQQGEDMLLVISNASKNTARAKPTPDANPVAAKTEEDTTAVLEKPADHTWGQSLPEEVLINIFQMVVTQDGAVPFLCRMARVCQLWNIAAASPILWRKVTVGHCWIAPGKKQLPKTEMKIQKTFDWLTQNRFVVSQSCPHLRSLTLSNCSGIKASAFQILGLNSRSLQSINVQFSDVEGLVAFLENHGNQMKQIWFTNGLKNDRLLASLTRGCCPDLEFLEVNKKLDSKDCVLTICIQALQAACPKLKTFRLLNVRPIQKTKHKNADLMKGFPLLEELCIATTSYSYMTDNDLLDILFSSTKLRVLDLRGCSRITPSGLANLPCLELEFLFWGQYFNSHIGLSTPKKGLHMVTQKWKQTLQQLDIGNQLFSEEDLEMAMSYLTQATESDTLRSLNLQGTRITAPALRSVIHHMTALSYLNLSSCRHLPRGVKRIYCGQEDIRQLLGKLE